MVYYLAADHAGFMLKEFVLDWLLRHGFETKDLGTHNTQRVDYPLYAQKLIALIKNEDRGVLICGSGIGMSIAANRFMHIRAALCHDAYTAELARKHNNANVLCMGARIIGIGVAESILEAFAKTHFESGRHAARLQQIEDYRL